MLDQLDLPLSRSNRRRIAQRGGLDRILRILAESGAWLSAAEILQIMGLTPTEHNKRWLRLIAENSDGQILSGQSGYRLTALASPAEIQQAAAWLEHQAKRMADRARAIRRRAHQLI